jgi:hypothetical protein
MRETRRSLRPRKITAFLLLVLALSIPVATMAGLASFDLTGTPRAAPATMGALEADTGAITQPPAPTGLIVTIQRNAS